MATGSDYDEVCAWLGDWPDGCTIRHLSEHFHGYRPKKGLTKWLKNCEQLAVFEYEGIEDGAVRFKNCQQPTVASGEATTESWSEAFLKVTPSANPPYAEIQETPTPILEAVLAFLLLRKEHLVELQSLVETALDERGWDESDQR